MTIGGHLLACFQPLERILRVANQNAPLEMPADLPAPRSRDGPIGASYGYLPGNDDTQTNGLPFLPARTNARTYTHEENSALGHRTIEATCSSFHAEQTAFGNY